MYHALFNIISTWNVANPVEEPPSADIPVIVPPANDDTEVFDAYPELVRF